MEPASLYHGVIKTGAILLQDIVQMIRTMLSVALDLSVMETQGSVGILETRFAHRLEDIT